MRARIGDLIAIPVTGGIAYAQYTHEYARPPKYGSILHVLDGVHPSPRTDFAAILAGPLAFYAFTSVKAGVRDHGWSVAARLDVRADWEPFPLFRTKAGGPDRPGWKIFDAGERRMADLPADKLAALPVLAVWVPNLVARSIVEGWRPQFDPV